MRRLLVLLALLVACGGGGTRTAGGRTKRQTPKLPPVKQDALTQFDAGMRALKLGGAESLETALPRFERAVDIDPTLWEGWYNLGIVRFQQGDDEAAAEAFGRAIDINPAYIPAVLGRAEARRRHGSLKQARADYKVVIEEQPSGEAYARLASLLRDMDDFEEALDVCRDALRKVGGSSAIYVELGLIYLAQERIELAELVLGKASALNKNDPAIYNALALVALARGQDQLAFERFDYATSLDPSFHDARFNVATVLLDVGDYAGAKAQLERVLQANPDDLDLQVALGVALRGLKQFDQARAAWERVVKSAPRRSRVRGDALFNLAVLEIDFVMDENKGKAALQRYLDNAPRSHHKRKEAEDRKKEMGL